MSATTETPPVEAHVVDGTAEDITPAAAPAQPHAVAIRPGSTDLIHAASAAERVEIATEIATALDNVIKQQGMRTKVGKGKVVGPDGTERWEDKYHVNVEGWQTLATFLGLAVAPVWSRQVMDPATGRPERIKYTQTVKRYHPKNQGGGVKEETTAEVDGYSWEARVEVYKDGALIGAGEAMCSRHEATWAHRDDFALRGMAQTRATSRAIGAAARWIVALAGYAATPAEEMPAQADTEPAAVEIPSWAEHIPQEGPQIKAFRQALGTVLDGDVDRCLAVEKVARESNGGWIPAGLAAAFTTLAANVKKGPTT